MAIELEIEVEAPLVLQIGIEAPIELQAVQSGLAVGPKGDKGDPGDDPTINSIVAGEPAGSDQVINVVSLTQGEYDAGTIIPTTLYIITT